MYIWINEAHTHKRNMELHVTFSENKQRENNIEKTFGRSILGQNLIKQHGKILDMYLGDIHRFSWLRVKLA